MADLVEAQKQTRRSFTPEFKLSVEVLLKIKRKQIRNWIAGEENVRK